MKFKGTKISKRTTALLAAAVIMLAGSGVTGTRAALNAIGPNYDATIATNSISVALTENGDAIKDGQELYSSLEGKAEPGYTYSDAIGVTNDGDAPEYVRVIVRKYWLTPQGEAVEPAEGEEAAATGGKKDTALTPDMIVLNEDKGAWIKTSGGSAETSIYYLKRQLTTDASGKNATLFDSVKIDKSVATDRRIYLTDAEGKKEITEAQVSSVTAGTITYEYKYNGYTFHVEAEAQSVQTHKPADAMASVWGVDVTMSGDNIASVK